MGFLYGFIKVTYYELAQDSGVELKIRCRAEIVDRNIRALRVQVIPSADRGLVVL